LETGVGGLEGSGAGSRVDLLLVEHGRPLEAREHAPQHLFYAAFTL